MKMLNKKTVRYLIIGIICIIIFSITLNMEGTFAALLMFLSLILSLSFIVLSIISAISSMKQSKNCNKTNITNISTLLKNKKFLILTVIFLAFELVSIVEIFDEKNIAYLFAAIIYGIMYYFIVFKKYAINKNTNIKDEYLSNGNSVLATDGNMFTKLRNVTKNCIYVDGLNRQDALKYLNPNTQLHIQRESINGVIVYLVVTEDSIDLGEISRERTEILEDEYKGRIEGVKLLNVTGGTDGKSYGCNISIELSDDIQNYEMSKVSFGNYVSPSGGYVNYAEFEVKGIKASTNRKNTVKISAFDEENAIELVKKQYGLIEPYEVKSVPIGEPTEKQLAYASGVGLVFPNDINIEDISAMLNRYEDYYADGATQELADYASNLGIMFSAYVGYDELICRIINHSDIERCALYAYAVHQSIKNKKIGNIFEDANFEKYYEFANYALNDPSVLKSIQGRSYTDYLNPSKTTIAYKKVIEFLI